VKMHPERFDKLASGEFASGESITCPF